MQERVAGLQVGWRKRGHDLALGIGIALGFATLGRIGFEGRFDYGAVGSVVNLAARLCGEATGGQILLAERAYAAVKSTRRSIWLSSGGLLVLTILLLWRRGRWLHERVTRPIRAAGAAASRIAGGDLSVTIVEGPDSATASAVSLSLHQALPSTAVAPMHCTAQKATNHSMWL